MLNWINLFALAPLQGYVYFEALIDSQTNRAVGWSSRTAKELPYSYDIVYSDGVNEVRSTRGTWEHARYAVAGLAIHFNTHQSQSAGLPVPALLRFASEGWNISGPSNGTYLITRLHSTNDVEAQTIEQVIGEGSSILNAILDAASKA